MGSEATWAEVERLLPNVERPSRYIDSEWNARHDEGAAYKVALLYPDTYELGMANQAIAILYQILSSIPGVAAERCFVPWKDMAAEMRAAGVPLFALESGDDVRSFQMLGITLPYELTYTNVLEALDLHETKVPLLTLAASIFGAVAVFGLAYWASAIDYPLNIGGRPLNSWPAFIPATFEGAVFHGGLAAAIGMILLNGLPRPYHPVFNVKRFVEHASKDGYFLVIESEDPRFAALTVRRFLEGLAPVEVSDVEN